MWNNETEHWECEFMRAEHFEFEFIRAEKNIVSVNFTRAEHYEWKIWELSIVNENSMRAETCKCVMYESRAV